MKVAQFKSLQWEYITVARESFENNAEYIRISEWVDVEFTPIDPRKQELDKLQKALLESQQKCSEESERIRKAIKELEDE
jgi:hypothetical protein